MQEKQFVASWSGGKDAAMAYYRALQAGGLPKKLWTMFEKNQEQSKSHALPLEVIEAQAAQLQVPFMKSGADWEGYEAAFLDAMQRCVDEGIPYGVFGDIDLEDHLHWIQQTCAKVGMTAIHPLWMEPRRKILEEFIEVGFVAYVVVVNTKMMPASYIGRQFTIELMDELEAIGVDACGESGEFHTVVTDGPIFQQAIPLEFGEVLAHDGYVFQKTSLKR